MEAPQLLVEHLSDWLGVWPSETSGLTIVGSQRRVEPGWDGDIRDVLGVSSPTGGVLSVPPSAVRALSEIVRGNSVEEDLALLNEHKAVVAHALGRTGQFGGGFFRWSLDPTPGEDVGEWVPTEDARVPAWLKPFNGDVLVAWDDDEKKYKGFNYNGLGNINYIDDDGIRKKYTDKIYRRQTLNTISTYPNNSIVFQLQLKFLF